MKRTPHEFCTIREAHSEHMFTVFGFITPIAGAHVDCAGKDD